MIAQTLRRAALAAGFITLLAGVASAGSIGIAFRDTTVVGGTLLEYPVYIDSSVTGLGVSAFEIQVAYSTSTLTFVDATLTGSLADGWSTFDANEISSGVVRVAGAGDTNLSGTGKLVILRFQVKPATYNTSAYMTFQSVKLNEGIPATNQRNGTVYITQTPSITVSPDTWVLARGETKQFTVSGGTPPYVWSSTQPSFASVDASGLLTALAPGITRVVCTDSSGIVDTTGVIDVRGVRLTIRDTSVYQGQEVLVPINTTSLNGLGISSGQITLNYWTSGWTPVGVELTGTLLESTGSAEFGVSNGKVTIAFAATSALTGSGVLAYVRFEASTTTYGYSTLSFDQAIFNENLPAATTNGSFAVLQLASLSVSPSYSQSLLAGDSLHFTVSGGVPPYVWSLSDSSKGSVSSSGWLRGIRSGNVVVSVQDSNGATGSSGTISIYDFKVSVPDTSFIPAGSVLVPIFVTPNSPGFVSYQMKVTYPTYYYLVLDSVITAGTLSNGWSVVTGTSPGSVQIAAATGMAPVQSGGILCLLKFAVPDSTPRPSTTTIQLTDVSFNEGFPLPLVDNGYVQIADRSTFGVNPSSASFKTTSLAEIDTAVFTVQNTGTATLTSSIYVSGSSEFSVLPTYITVPAGSSTTVSLFYQASDYTPDAGTLSFSTNDPYHSYVQLAISGVTNRPPTVQSRQPATLDSVQQGGVVNFLVTATDPDADTLTYTWKVNGVVQQAGADSAFSQTFPTVVAGMSVVAVVEDPYGLKDSTTWTFDVVTSVGDFSTSLPESYGLAQNYPNPFNPSTTIRFALPVRSEVQLEVYNTLGQQVASLVQGERSAGYHQVVWQADVPSGIYYCRLTAKGLQGDGGSFVETRKMILLR